jgi:hypothetical protein
VDHDAVLVRSPSVTGAVRERGEPDMTPALIPDTVAVLTSADRCDRCGAQAATRVMLAGGYDLLSCSHHSRRYDEAQQAVANAMESQMADATGVLPGGAQR